LRKKNHGEVTVFILSGTTRFFCALSILFSYVKYFMITNIPHPLKPNWFISRTD